MFERGDGEKEQTVYSTEHLEKDGNSWVQKISTRNLSRPREIASQPMGIVYDDRSGNLVLALGIQGVVLGTPNGKWVATAVGRFEPTDFSFQAKTSMLLSDLEFWTASMGFALAMTGAALIASQHRREDLLRSILVAPLIGVAVMVMGGGIFILPLFLVLILVFFVLPTSPTVSRIVVTLCYIVPLGAIPLWAAFVVGSKVRRSELWNTGVIGIGSLAVLATGALIASFGFSPDNVGITTDLRFLALELAAWVLALTSLAVTWPLLFRHWVVVVASLGARPRITWRVLDTGEVRRRQLLLPGAATDGPIVSYASLCRPP